MKKILSWVKQMIKDKTFFSYNDYLEWLNENRSVLHIWCDKCKEWEDLEIDQHRQESGLFYFNWDKIEDEWICRKCKNICNFKYT